MVLDFTGELVPLFWAMVALLLLTGAGIVASVDPELGGRYMPDRRLLVVAATVALVAVVAAVGL